MPYANIVFIKLEKRLLNDYRWYTMSDHAQLLYIKLILLAAETYNKIPRNDDVLMQALRSTLEIGMFKGSMQEIRKNYPKFKCNKHFYYFDEFENKTNYIPTGKSQGNPKEIQRVCQNKNKNKNKNKSEEENKSLFGDFVLLTQDQYQKLCDEFTKLGADEKIKNLNLYIGSKGDKYKSHYHTILNWARKEEPTSNKIPRRVL